MRLPPHGADGPLRACALGILLILVSATAASPQDKPGAELPPLSWICPMHPDVIEAEAGECRHCRMDLVPVRLDLAWTCQVHPVVSELEAGRCPICARDLVRVTVAVAWSCPVHPEVTQLEPGTCSVCGVALVRRHTTRPHGDHNPKHGGLFFMAPDNWHHLEGTFPEPGIFRVHVYDDFSRPMSAKPFRGRAVTREVFDPATKTSRELMAYPLLPSADGEYLEARIPALDLPVRIAAKIRFDRRSDREHRFDFVFNELTRAPAPGSGGPAAPADAIAVEIPAEAPGIIRELIARRSRVEELIERGAYTDVWTPTFEAKELALALGDRLAAVPAARREPAAAAVRRLVLASWWLDRYGDIGDRQQLGLAYDMFAAAVADIEAAVGGPK